MILCGVICFQLGVLFGVFIMCLMSAAKSADHEIEGFDKKF